MWHITHPAVVDKSKIFLRPLLINFGLIKMSVKAMDKESKGFTYLRQKFPKISEAKMKEGIIAGLEIKKLFEDQGFSTELNSTERRAWKAFQNVCRNFLGNEKAENYSEIMKELISSYSAMGCNVSLKPNFLHAHLDLICPN
jgi:hypothetical protein